MFRGGGGIYNPASVAITGGTISGITTFSGATITATTAFIAPATVAPVIAFTGDTTTGFGRITSNEVGYFTNNALRMYFGRDSDAVFQMGSGYTFTWASTVAANGGAADTGMTRISAGLVGVGTGAQGSFAGSLKASNLITTGAAASAGASTVAFGGTTQTTIGANGGASALTALPLGYITVNVGGTAAIIPYYNA
jgi:hypothetical protein